MKNFKNRESYLKSLEKKFRDASTQKHKLIGKKITTYKDISIISNADGYSLAIVKKVLSPKCFEHIQAYQLDLNIRDIRMLQIIYNSIEKYWLSGLFDGTDKNQYKTQIKKLKKYVYASMALDFNKTKRYIEVPIMPHVLQGLLRLYYIKIQMPKKTIDIIMSIFERERQAKINHEQIDEIDSLCESLQTKLNNENINLFNIEEKYLYPIIINHFGQDYFITKPNDTSR